MGMSSAFQRVASVDRRPSPATARRYRTWGGNRPATLPRRGPPSAGDGPNRPHRWHAAGPEANPLDLVGEPGGVPWRAAAPVVVEVDEALLVGRPAIGEAVRPGLERRPTVRRPRDRPTLVESQVCPVGRAPQRRPDTSPVGQAYCRTMIDQDSPDLVDEPARMAKLDGDANPWGKAP